MRRRRSFSEAQRAVPTQVVEVLATLNEFRHAASELPLPGKRDHEKPISNSTTLIALERMGYKGWRPVMVSATPPRP